jgi:hypothetical protein
VILAFRLFLVLVVESICGRRLSIARAVATIIVTVEEPSLRSEWRQELRPRSVVIFSKSASVATSWPLLPMLLLLLLSPPPRLCSTPARADALATAQQKRLVVGGNFALREELARSPKHRLRARRQGQLVATPLHAAGRGHRCSFGAGTEVSAAHLMQVPRAPDAPYALAERMCSAAAAAASATRVSTVLARITFLLPCQLTTALCPPRP